MQTGSRGCLIGSRALQLGLPKHLQSTCACMHACMRVNAAVHTHVCVLVCERTVVRTCMRVCGSGQARALLPCTCKKAACVHALWRDVIGTCMLLHVHTHICAHTRARARTYTRRDAHTRKHANPYLHACTHAMCRRALHACAVLTRACAPHARVYTCARRSPHGVCDQSMAFLRSLVAPCAELWSIGQKRCFKKTFCGNKALGRTGGGLVSEAPGRTGRGLVSSSSISATST